MTVSDSDLELLETLLDGELPEADQEPLRRRLIFEPALSAAMETLRTERALRVRVWQSFEPSEQSIAQVTAGVDRKVTGHLHWSRTLSRLRMVSAAAACIVVGVMVGRFGDFKMFSPQSNPTGTTVAQPANTVARATPGASGTIASPPIGSPVELAIVDEYGNVVDKVKLSPNEAVEMTTDFRRESERSGGSNGNAVLTNTPAPQGDF